MFGLLRGAFTLLIIVLIVGLYLGWFSFTKTSQDPQSDKVNVNVSVDKQKIGADLKKFEQNVAKRIQNVDTQPQGNAPAPPPGQQTAAPGMSFGPISIQSNAQPMQQPNGQPAAPAWSVGPYSAQPPSQPVAPANNPPAGQTQFRVQTPDFQFTVPLAVPPPGDGR